MAMLKTITPRAVSGAGMLAATQGVSGYLSDAGERQLNQSRLLAMSRYLAGGHGGQAERIVAHGHSDDILCDEVRGWEREFVETKVAHGKLEGIPYYHFIISPDPADRVGADECLALAREWVEACHPGSQWFAAIHDDNTHHITHAHIIVNSVLPASGRKIHRAKSDVLREARTLNRLCMEHGLTQMEDLAERARRARGHGANLADAAAASVSKEEQAMLRRGARSYKATMRATIDAAASQCTSWRDFVTTLAGEGVEVSYTRKGVTYTLRDFEGDGARRIQASRFGGAYTYEGIMGRLGVEFDALLGMKVSTPGRPAVSPRRAHVLAMVRVRARPLVPRARHVSADGMIRYRTLSELLGARVATTREHREASDVIAAARCLQRGQFATRGELTTRIEEATDALALAQERMDELDAAEARARRVADTIVRVRDARDELSRLNARRSWNPAERARRRELEGMVSDQSGWVESELSRASLWAGATGGDASASPQRFTAELLNAIRKERPGAAAALDMRKSELEELMLAERVLRSLDYPARGPVSNGKVPHARKGGGKMAKEGTTLPHVSARQSDGGWWPSVALSIEIQMSASSVASHDAEIRERERRRRLREGDEWLRTHGIDPMATPAEQRQEAPRRGHMVGISNTERREQ